MTSSPTGKIISLTYHEITRDPRVLKEARALRQAGFDVHVYCQWPEGLPQRSEINGVQITRFKCYDYAGVRKSIFDELTFLDKSRDRMAKRYLPFAAECEHLQSIRPFLESKFGPNVIERAQSTYFKQTTGSLRTSRLLEYLYLNLRLHFLRVPVQSVPSELVHKHDVAKNRVDLRTFRNLRRNLFQVQSVVYCSNLPEPDPEEKIAAIHAHDLYSLPAGVMLSRRFGVPLIYDAHEYEPSRATKMDREATDLPELIEDDCFPHVRRIITVSEGIGELYAQRFQGAPPVIVMNAPEVDSEDVKNGVSVREGLKTVREQIGLHDDVPLLVFTGGIQGTHRGVDKVLEAMTLLPETHFVSLGARYENDDRWFLGIAEKLGVKDRVTLLPPVDARDVPAAISSATVSVVPIQDASLSYRYCLPNKLFEAAFARIPVCVSDLPEMRKFVEALNIGVTVDQTDPKAIAAALQDLIDNRSAYLLSPSAEQTLAENYSWQAQTTKLLDLFKDIVSPPPA